MPPARRIALLGIPLESGAADPGALMGPDALRTAGIARVLRDLGHDVTDHGDVAPPDPTGPEPPFVHESCRNAREVAAWTRAIHDRAHALMATGDVPLFLGGDHSMSMGTVSAVARHCRERGRDLAVLWLDAHADFNTPASTPSGNMHGMAVSFLLGEPTLVPLIGARPFQPLPAGRVHLFGLRSVDREERALIAARGLDCVDMRDIDEHGVAVLARRLIGGLDPARTHLHVSLDVDALDPSVAPAVGTAVPGGLTFREAHLMMEMLHESGLVGSLDIVELNPFLDERGRSAKVLVDLAASLFGRTILARGR